MAHKGDLFLITIHVIRHAGSRNTKDTAIPCIPRLLYMA